MVLSACSTEKTEAPVDVKVEQVELSPMDAALAGTWREAEAKRDGSRHPKETLAFFGLEPGQSVVEIFPGGGGWYTTVLAPYIAQTGGTYTAAVFDEGYGERGTALNARFKQKFSDTEVFGTINTVPFGSKAVPMMDAEADLILSFRNVHSWMGRGYEKKAFADFYKTLKPGGVLGIVEHRLPETAEQNPKAPTGYVQVSYTKALAAEAGFEFVGASDVNANPKDTADHPFGVWTLPPVSRTPRAGDESAEGFDAQKYVDIGESDRFTLKFKKPE
jgi:predicted methyltransferase